MHNRMQMSGGHPACGGMPLLVIAPCKGATIHP